MAKQLTAVYEKHEEWYVAYLEEIPGVNTQGRTLEEARANLEDALQEFLAANRALAKKDISGREQVVEEPFAIVERAASNDAFCWHTSANTGVSWSEKVESTACFATRTRDARPRSPDTAR